MQVCCCHIRIDLYLHNKNDLWGNACACRVRRVYTMRSMLPENMRRRNDHNW